MPFAEMIGDFLVMDSFTYERCEPSKPKRSSDDEDDTKTYWRCRSRNNEGKKCRAGAITDGPISPGMTIAAKQISRGSGHNHLPPSQPHLDTATQDSRVTSMTSSGSSTETASPSSSMSDVDEVQSSLAEPISPLQLEKSAFAEVDPVERQDVAEPTSGPTVQADSQEVQQESVGPEANLLEDEAPQLIEDAAMQHNGEEIEETITGDVSDFGTTQHQLSSLAEEVLFMEMKSDPSVEPVPEPVVEKSPTVLQQDNPLRIKIQGLAQKQNYMPMQTDVMQQNTCAFTPCQQSSVPSEPTKAKKSRKRKVGSGGFAKDVHRYHRFLIELMRNPLFLKENIMKALEVVYRSEFSVMAAYVTVLENKDKILNDLRALMNNPEMTIYSLHGLSSTSMRTNPLMQDILNSDKILQSLRYPTENVMSLNDQGPDDFAVDCPRPCKRANVTQHHPTIPPVPAAVPIRELTQNKRFVPLVDLENDCESILDLSSGIKVEKDDPLGKEKVPYPGSTHGVTRLLEDFNHSSAPVITQNQHYCTSSLPDPISAMAQYPIDHMSMINNTFPNEKAAAQHMKQRLSLDSHLSTSGIHHRVFCFVQKCGRIADTNLRMQMPTQDDASFSLQHNQ